MALRQVTLASLCFASAAASGHAEGRPGGRSDCDSSDCQEPWPRSLRGKAPTSPATTPLGGGAWQRWEGAGITYHGPAYDVDVYCPASDDKPIGNACWRLDNDPDFKTDVLAPYCARADLIAFGHPADVECGECTEIRVQRLDGAYNTITVMTTDNPGSGGVTSSPELSTAGKEHLTQGTGKQLNDRLPFEWRKVSCAAPAAVAPAEPSAAPAAEPTAEPPAALMAARAAEPTAQPQPQPTAALQVPSEPPRPAGEECTGDAEVDAVLTAAGVKASTLLSTSSIYTFEAFCQGVRSLEAVGHPLYGGSGTGAARVAQVLSNIASLLAQCMWESGGEAPWSACDENNFRGWETAACTQREDGVRYDSLTEPPPACDVDPQMRMTAVTYADWTPGPLECVPGTVTEGCCWWGRGAIQTTGPRNYRLLQDEVVSKIDSLSGTDLCTNPQAICQVSELKWLGAMYYWASVVQDAAQFQRSLEAYVATGFDDAGSVVDGNSFNAGTGAMVNNGNWASTAHGNEGRMRYFNQIVDAMKAAGMGAGLPTVQPTEPPSGCAAVCAPQGDTCYVAGWASPCFTPPDGRRGCEALGGEFCG